MALLSDGDRFDVWARWMRENAATLGGLTKQQLRTAINAVDQWVEDNTASFNQAIPLPARTELTAMQKARLLMFVVRRRFEVS